MINGIINVYKEKGFTSFDVVAVMRGIAGQRKVGHTGTLDPDAEGVLPVCLGNATKLCDMLTDKRKEYVAQFLLGKRTDTLDISGTVLEERVPTVSEDKLKETILSFVGGYSQYPPMYSAKKVNGQKLVDMARKGVSIERKPVFVDIYEIEILKMEYPYVTIRVACGKGTYIRSLCEDIGAKCGELAVMTLLKRTRVNEFTVDDALTLKELQNLKDAGKLLSIVKPTDSAFSEYKALRLDASYRKLIDNGNKLPIEACQGKLSLEDGETVRVYNDAGCFVALYKLKSSEGVLSPFKMFIGE